MGKYAVPEKIRNHKPVGTMVKVINNKYYVYEQSHVKEDNKWKIKMGKLIGSINPELGFIPNDNYSKNDKLTTFDFGEYFLVNELSKSILEKLKSVFNVKEATNIYNLALIHFVNGFTYIKNVKPLYDLSYLSIKYPSLNLSEYMVSNLLNDLGRHQQKVEQFEDMLIEESSREYAIDGHAIKSSSCNNSLAEEGNKKYIFKDKQVNLLMAYDINTSRPILSRMYSGSTLDNISIKDLFERKNFQNILFILDRGFYSLANIKMLSNNGNKYIIPLKTNSLNYKEITKDYITNNLFVYEKNKKKSVIEYKEEIINGTRVMFFKDQSENAIESADYLSKINDSEGIYTMEKYNLYKNLFGTIVLESNLEKSAEEIYKLYKRRWTIETFYDYYKNRLDVNAIHLSDYYQTQGLSFIMLITSLIYSEFKSKTKFLKRSETDILLDARFIKLHLRQKKWKIENTCKKHYKLFQSLNINMLKEIELINNQYNMK